MRKRIIRLAAVALAVFGVGVALGWAATLVRSRLMPPKATTRTTWCPTPEMRAGELVPYPPDPGHAEVHGGGKVIEVPLAIRPAEGGKP